MANVSFFVGAPGNGKTTAINAKLRDPDTRPARAIILDPFAGDVKDSIQCEEFVNGDLKTALRRIDSLSPDGKWSISYRPPSGTEAYAAAWLAEAAFARRATLIIDEAHESCGQHTTPLKIIEIAKRGRHSGVALWLATQRPADVNRNLTASSERFFFALDEAVDRDYVRRTLGTGAARMVREFKKGEFLYKNGNELRLGRVYWERGKPHMEFTKELSYEDID